MPATNLGVSNASLDLHESLLAALVGLYHKNPKSLPRIPSRMLANSEFRDSSASTSAIA